MQVYENVKGQTLYIKLVGDMDEFASSLCRQKCDKLIDTYAGVSKLIFNLSEVAFMDSTGIGFLIGRYKKAQRLGIATYVQDPNFSADKILNLSGIYTLIPKAE